MSTIPDNLPSISTNARIGAIALAVSGIQLLALSHLSMPLSPLHLLTVVLGIFGAWCFAEEMGLRKPLNRAGLVLLCIAMMIRVQSTLGVPDAFAGRYALLYVAFLMSAVLLWSVALLHRQRTLKMIGAVALAASLSPLALLVLAHLAIGAGALLGANALVAAAEGTAPLSLTFVAWAERLFALWSLLAAAMLWRGLIR